MALAETANLAVRISLQDKLTPGLGNIKRSLGTFDTGIGRVGRGVGKLSKAFGTAGLYAGGAVVTGLGLAAKAAIDYEEAFQGVVKTVDSADLAAAGLTFKDLSDSIRKMSREMPNSAIELAGIAEAAGALGIKAGDIEAFTKQVAILASTTNVSADDAATALGQLQNVIGLTGDEFDNFAATLVDLGNKGNSTEADILEVARRSGGAAKLIGIAKDETVGWAAAAANLGLNQELAGTALQRFFLKSLEGTKAGSKSLALFAKVSGTSSKAFKKQFDKDAGGALQRFVKGLSKLPKDARLATIQKLFGKGTGLTRLLLDLSSSVDKNLTPSLNTSTEAWKDATAAAEEFEKRNQTVKSAFSRLKNNVLDAAVTIGAGFAPALGRAADKLSAFLSQDGNRSKLEAIGEDIGKAIDRIDFDKLLKTAEGVGAALKPALATITKLAELIAKLPPELLGAGAAVAVTNKVTGGLVLSGLGDIFGGLGTTLARTLASQIPVFGKAFVQPVYVTNMGVGGAMGGGGSGAVVPGGKGASGLGKIVSAASKLLLVGFVAEAAVQLKPVLVDLGAGIREAFGAKPVTAAEMPTSDLSWPWGAKNTPTILPEVFGGNGLLGGDAAAPVVDAVQALKMDTHAEAIATRNAIVAATTDGARTVSGDTRSEGIATRNALSGVKQKQAESLVAFRLGERATQGVSGKLNVTNDRLAAIRAKKTQFSMRTFVNVNTRVSVSEFQRQARYTSRVARSTILAVD